MGTALRILVVATDGAAVEARCAVVERARGVVAGATHLGSAAHDRFDLDGVDVAVVDLLGPPGGFDRVLGVPTIRDLAGAVPRVIACGPPGLGAVIHLRARRAGASSLVTGDELPALLTPGALDACPAIALDEAALALVGLSRSSDPDAGLEHIADEGLEGAFEGTEQLSRRRTITVRTVLAERIGIVTTVSGSGAVVDRRVPSWAQVREVIDLARGAGLRRRDRSDGT